MEKFYQPPSFTLSNVYTRKSKGKRARLFIQKKTIQIEKEYLVSSIWKTFGEKASSIWKVMYFRNSTYFANYTKFRNIFEIIFEIIRLDDLSWPYGYSFHPSILLIHHAL